ncbi:ABC transporter related [Candidatus Accumulibacter aalborgensis]|uniref:ABC transporter related n=1 Tax=Candidatus Accumulibacter aalborgensis TaxID=1860102 RepID=A0A1A8XVG4_9PROT|nr:ABC transporter ATP-binding protein [Candidatus Accumulibacter aalborgensis]SBT08582.1 ABC transporter related [Candidatus Accumulibacter aalborgensis]
MSSLKLRQIGKRFGNVVAVSGLDLEVARGECVALLGPSGCGKTTTLRMVAGFEDIDEGEIEAGDKLLSSKERNYYLPPEQRDFGMVFQAFAVWPHLSVHENVAFPLRVRKLPAAEIERRVRAALAHTDLLAVAASRPDDLSGGGKQRVALARALAIQPAVMLLDEPLSSLDPHFREEMRFEIKDIQRRLGFSMLYVTHDQSEAMALSDRILVMKNGVVQQVGSPREVYYRPANRFVFGFIGLSSFLRASFAGGGIRVGDVPMPLAVAGDAPAGLVGTGEAVLAVRPADVDFVSEGGLRGVARRRAFLGEIVDYQIAIGTQALRVQKLRHETGPHVGENCDVTFADSNWYPMSDAGE